MSSCEVNLWIGEMNTKHKKNSAKGNRGRNVHCMCTAGASVQKFSTYGRRSTESNLYSLFSLVSFPVCLSRISFYDLFVFAFKRSVGVPLYHCMLGFVVHTNTSRHIKLHYRCAFCSFVFIHKFLYFERCFSLFIGFVFPFYSLESHSTSWRRLTVCACAKVVRLLRNIFFSFDRFVRVCASLSASVWYVYPFCGG